MLIPVPSSVVNAVMFVVAELVALEVAQKGIHALQGIYLYRLARGGKLSS